MRITRDRRTISATKPGAHVARAPCPACVKEKEAEWAFEMEELKNSR